MLLCDIAEEAWHSSGDLEGAAPRSVGLVPFFPPLGKFVPEIFCASDAEEIWCHGDDDVVAATKNCSVKCPEVRPEIDQDDNCLDFLGCLENGAVDS